MAMTREEVIASLTPAQREWHDKVMASPGFVDVAQFLSQVMTGAARIVQSEVGGRVKITPEHIAAAALSIASVEMRDAVGRAGGTTEEADQKLADALHVFSICTRSVIERVATAKLDKDLASIFGKKEGGRG